MNMTNEEMINNYIKKETPQKIIHYKHTYPSHKWALNKKGEPDNFAFESGYHNGYCCTRCWYCFCEHCDPDGFDKEPCIVEYDECSSCHKRIIDYKKIFYCEYCGQKLDGNNIEEISKIHVR